MRILNPLIIVFGIALSWFCLDLLNKNFFQFLQVNDFLYSIYWLSGVRLIAIILFGWLGALGLFIGYICGGILIRGFGVEAAISLGALSALAPLLAFTLWEKITGLSHDFKGVTVRNLLLLVLLHSSFTAVLRTSYFYFISEPKSIDYIVSVFMANLVGSTLLLYTLKCMHSAYKFFAKPS